jgi:hypothetical protein
VYALALVSSKTRLSLRANSCQKAGSIRSFALAY